MSFEVVQPVDIQRFCPISCGPSRSSCKQSCWRRQKSRRRRSLAWSHTESDHWTFRFQIRYVSFGEELPTIKSSHCVAAHHLRFVRDCERAVQIRLKRTYQVDSSV